MNEYSSCFCFSNNKPEEKKTESETVVFKIHTHTHNGTKLENMKSWLVADVLLFLLRES